MDQDLQLVPSRSEFSLSQVHFDLYLVTSAFGFIPCHKCIWIYTLSQVHLDLYLVTGAFGFIHVKVDPSLLFVITSEFGCHK